MDLGYRYYKYLKVPTEKIGLLAFAVRILEKYQ